VISLITVPEDVYCERHGPLNVILCGGGKINTGAGLTDTNVMAVFDIATQAWRPRTVGYIGHLENININLIHFF